MKKIIGAIIICLAGCNSKPALNYKIKLEKISEDCRNIKPSMKMLSDLGGEHYEFERCLSNGFSKDDMKIDRHGDTVSIWFDPIHSKQQMIYKFDIDIDSDPRYNFLTIGDETFIISAYNQ
jgi:hypothetical protein